MGHELEAVNGRIEMFSGMGKVPWHGLGTVVQGRLTAAEAIVAASLEWPVGFRPITVNGVELSMEDYQATCRMDTGACLGVVKGRYELIQNVECFDFLDSLVKDGELQYETAGALRGGKVVWMMAKYDGQIEIAGDKHNQWLLLVTSHDGSKCLECCWVTERVVCANTLSIALRGKRNSVKIRHSGIWESKQKEAQRVLGLTQDYFSDMKATLEKLQDRAMSPDDMEAFTKLLYPVAGEKDGKPVPTRTSNQRWGTARLFNRPAGGTSGATAWDGLNAVTDYADHVAPMRGQTTRLESALLGSGAELKQRAVELLTGEDFFKQIQDVRNWKTAPVVVPVAESIPTHVQVAGLGDFDRLLGK